MQTFRALVTQSIVQSKRQDDPVLAAESAPAFQRGWLGKDTKSGSPTGTRIPKAKSGGEAGH